MRSRAANGRHGRAVGWRDPSQSAAAWSLAFLFLALVAVTGSVTAAPPESDDHFLSKPEEPLTQYRAFRRMHARSERIDQEGWLDAWTEYDRRRGFRYEIVSERGSDSVRNKVLRAVLRREQELVASGEEGRGDLTPQNYDFEEAAAGQNDERYVRIKPKRKDVLLVDGRMVLNRDGTELLRVEGRLAKNPSFWTSLVNIIRHYARLDGVRVPISTETSAKLKFVGLSYLDVRYEYETINGRRVSAEARRVIAPVVAR